MDKKELKDKPSSADEVSLGDILGKLSSAFRYIISRWRIILIAGATGGVLFLAYAIFQKPTYTATSTFVLEDGSRSGMLGQYAGLASLAGVNLDNGENGLFQGDNIFELYKSRLMIEKTLLSKADFNGKKEQLIERYIDFNQLRHKWESKDKINHINFNGDPRKFNRTQDSIIIDITKLFNKKFLSVGKPDKKLDIIEVDVKSKDELFAKVFADKLVENVNLFYVQTKTKKSYQNLMVLQHQADSVRIELNKQINSVASAIDAAPNANPLLQTLRVPSQRGQVDVQASSAIYAEVVKNLEIAKISLRKETPLIQMIDEPILPLDNNKLKKPVAFIEGFLLFASIACFWIGIKKIVS